MHRTRSLFASQHKSRPTSVHALRGLQIPLRGYLEVLASSAQACASFALSLEKRERFRDLANRGTINPVALGIPLSLALYHDLSSPLFEKYGFDVDEFFAGARVALENFYDVQFRLLHELAGERLGREMMDGFNVLDEWEKRADSDPESLHGLLSRMVTPDYFQFAALMMTETMWKGQIEERLPRLKNWKGEATNLNLLSARAATIPPPRTTQEDLSRMTKEEIQKNDEMINNVYADLPVVAQLEVLYDYKITIPVPLDPHGGNSGTRDSRAKPLTQSKPFVGVFEGWLHGSPTGSLQWKLALNRPFCGV